MRSAEDDQNIKRLQMYSIKPLNEDAVADSAVKNGEVVIAALYAEEV
jgi:transketolase C-terminal domain/subunit